MRYRHELSGKQWSIVDGSTGEIIGVVHDGIVAAQVVTELNKMEKRRA